MTPMTAMKRFAMAAALMLTLAPQTYAGPWLKSLATAQKKAKDSNSLIFVDMYADWCGWCHKMEQEVFPSEPFQNATDKMVLLRLNTEDGADGTQLARKFQVSSLPTFLLITGDGTLAGVIRGYSPAPVFSKAVTDSEVKYNDFLRRVKNEADIAGDYQKRLDLAVEFAERQNFQASETRLRQLIGDKKAPADVRDKAYLNLAVAMFNAQKPEKSLETITAFGKVQSKGDTYERARLLGAQVLYTQGKFNESAAALRKFKQEFPKSTLIPQVDALLPQVEQRISAK